MPVFAYKGIGPAGKAVDGVRDAESPKSLRQILRKEGVIVTDFHERKAKVGAIGTGSGLKREVHIFTGVKKQDVAAFTGQLATLLQAGIPLAEALAALFEQVDHVKFKAVLGEIKTLVNEGSSLADALAKHPEVFTELYVSMVRAGEAAGNLDAVLRELAEFLESAQRLQGKVSAAMIYPMIMMVVGFGILIFLMVTVIPQVSDIYSKQKAELPLKTQFLIGLSGILMKGKWIIPFAIVGAIWGIRKWLKSPRGRAKWDAFKLRAPKYGTLTKKVAVARFCRTTGTMLGAGVPMLRVLDIAKEILGNTVLIAAVERARQAVTEGESLAVTLQKTGYFPSTVIRMVAVGERAGALESMLIRVADAYDREVELELNRFTAFLGPILLLIMAGGVAFMVFAILEPLLGMQQFSL
jgi:general secretion pathway protein F